MRFGTPVLVERGGGSLPGKPGCKRFVRGVLVGRRGHESFVRLTEDDPLAAVGWRKAGEIGHWSTSVIIRASDFDAQVQLSKELMNEILIDEMWAE